MRNCFIPNCDAFCKKNGMSKRMMFSAPKHNIQAWKVKLFYKRQFRETDRICERHFDQSQIITHWDYMINGKLCKLERDKPKLEPQAVPYLNLPDVATSIISPANIETKNSPRKRRKSTDSPVAKKKKPTKNGKKENVKEDQTNFDLETEDLADQLKELSEDLADPLKELSTEKKEQIFDSVYDDVYEIVLPTTLWGIHRDPDRKYITFTNFDIDKMACSKILYVNNHFEIRISIDGVLTKTANMDIVSVDILTDHLNALDESSSSELN